MSLKFVENDFLKMKEFALAWRWTDTNYWKASESELGKIRPLTVDSSRRLWDELCNKTFGEKQSIKESFFIDNAISCQTDGDPAQVIKWLKRIIPNKCTQLALFWKQDMAIITEHALFVPHWDDFCYPSSDDVIIWPIDAKWVLFYHHSEVFYFKQI